MIQSDNTADKIFVPISLQQAWGAPVLSRTCETVKEVLSCPGRTPAHAQMHGGYEMSGYTLHKDGVSYAPAFVLGGETRYFPWRNVYSIESVNVLVFDVTNADSFTRLTVLRHPDHGNQFSGHNQVPITILAFNPEGVKHADWMVPAWTAYDWATRNGYSYIELNARDDASVRSALATLTLEGADIAIRSMRRNGVIQAISAREREAQAREAERLANKGRLAQFYRKMFSFLFDLFQVVLACMDVTTDIWVVVQYWQAAQYTFFYIALCDLILAQIAYTIFFVLFYSEDSHWKTKLIAFFCILPFGQLIPLMIYIHSFHFKWIDSIFDFFNLKAEVTYVADGEDPLRVYLKQKLVAHAGFYLESLVEAIPQSILQMVAIVVTGQVTPVNVVSLVLSITSVGAKGLMMSYSIHRPTAVFSFCCILFDVFSVFTITSWLFFKSPIERYNVVKVFYISTPENIFTAIWFWKEFIFVIACAIGAMFMFIAITAENKPCGYSATVAGKRGQKTLEAIGILVAGIGLFLPILIVMEGMKLAVIPLILFHSIDSPHGRQMAFYSRLFSFLRGSDFTERIHATNHVLSRQFLSTHARVNHYGNGRRPHYLIHQDHNFATSEWVLQTRPEEFKLNNLRTAARYSYKGIMDFVKEIAVADHVNRECGEKLIDIGVRYCFFVIVPIWILSGLYSMIYPFLCLFTLDASVEAPLQRALTYVLIALLIILILLFRSVRRFRRSVFYVIMYDFYTVDLIWMDVIERVHSVFHDRRRVVRALGGVPKENSSPLLALTDNSKTFDFENGNIASFTQNDAINPAPAPQEPGLRTDAGMDDSIEEEIHYLHKGPPARQGKKPPTLTIQTDNLAPTPVPAATLSPTMLTPKSPAATLNEEETWMHFGVLPFLQELLGRVPALSALPTPMGRHQAFAEFHASGEHSHEGDEKEAKTEDKKSGVSAPPALVVPEATTPKETSPKAAAAAATIEPGAEAKVPTPISAPRSGRAGESRTPGGRPRVQPMWVDDEEDEKEQSGSDKPAKATTPKASTPMVRDDEAQDGEARTAREIELVERPRGEALRTESSSSSKKPASSDSSDAE